MMGFGENGVTPVYNLSDTNKNDDWGGGIIWIFFLFFLLAWGGDGFGFGGRGGVGAETALNGISNDFIYSNLNNALGQGFTQLTNQNFEISSALQNGFCQLGNGIATSTFELQRGIDGVSREISSCCCETNRNIDAVRYENAKNTCDIINNANMNTRDLLESNNAQTQRIIDTLTNQEIQNLRSELQSAQLSLQNNSQTANIISQLRPVPMPAYITCSPYASYNPPATASACAGIV